MGGIRKGFESVTEAVSSAIDDLWTAVHDSQTGRGPLSVEEGMADFFVVPGNKTASLFAENDQGGV